MRSALPRNAPRVCSLLVGVVALVFAVADIGVAFAHGEFFWGKLVSPDTLVTAPQNYDGKHISTAGTLRFNKKSAALMWRSTSDQADRAICLTGGDVKVLRRLEGVFVGIDGRYHRARDSSGECSDGTIQLYAIFIEME